MGMHPSASLVYGIKYYFDADDLPGKMSKYYQDYTFDHETLAKDIALLFDTEIEYDFQLDCVGLEKGWSGHIDSECLHYLYASKSEVWNYDYEFVRVKSLDVDPEWHEKLLKVTEFLGLDPEDIGWYLSVHYG